MPHKSATAGSIQEAAVLPVLNQQQPAISVWDLTALLAQPAVLHAPPPPLAVCTDALLASTTPPPTTHALTSPLQRAQKSLFQEWLSSPSSSITSSKSVIVRNYIWPFISK
jgi:hypothetical protein